MYETIKECRQEISFFNKKILDNLSKNNKINLVLFCCCNNENFFNENIEKIHINPFKKDMYEISFLKKNTFEEYIFEDSTSKIYPIYPKYKNISSKTILEMHNIINLFINLTKQKFSKKTIVIAESDHCEKSYFFNELLINQCLRYNVMAIHHIISKENEKYIYKTQYINFTP